MKAPLMRGPTMIGIGAQKCASTWVHDILGRHPEVGVSEPKEVDFFSYYFDRGYRWYEDHFSAVAARPTRFEASPSYLYDPRSPQRAHDYRPDLRILALLRDPVERAYSNHLHEVIKGHIPAVPFAEGLANNPAYVDQGRYAHHLGHWLKVFGRSQLLIILAEDIATDPEGIAEQVYRFAGVDPGFRSAVMHERRNESDRARLPLVRKTLRAGGATLRRLGLDEALSRVKRSGPVSRALAANSIDMRQVVPPMDAESRARLTEHFAPDVAALRSLLERDTLPWKNFGATADAPT